MMIIFMGILFAIAAYLLIKEGRPRTYCYTCYAILWYDSKRRVWVHPSPKCDNPIPVGIIK